MNVEPLSTYLEQAASTPAKLGHLDCVRFVTDCLLIGWGRDYRVHLGYNDRRSAVTRLRQAGGLYEGICEALGQDIPITDLGPGDIAWFPDPCIGILLPGPAGHIIAVKYRRTILRQTIVAARSGWKTWDQS